MTRHGGDRIAEILSRRGIRQIFTLCGGHISPILVGAKARGIQVIDTRHEVDAVFAADAAARLLGNVGVAAVTAGPGVTNSVTAIKNAQMAQTPLLLFGGATATVLKGRGSLQDIDQLSIMRPVTKWAVAVKTLSALAPTVERALDIAQAGVPGPVFIEVPIDLLYPEEQVREWYMKESGADKAKGLSGKALKVYLTGHLYRQFHAPHIDLTLPEVQMPRPFADQEACIERVASAIAHAEQPVLVIGSQTMVNCTAPARLADAVQRLGLPTYLGGSARGLLGRRNELQFRHARGAALKEADLVVVAGFPFDFRLKYGQAISSRATLVSANLSRRELRKNRRPDHSLLMHPGDFLERVAGMIPPPRDRGAWFGRLRDRESARDQEIAKQADDGAAKVKKGLVNPLDFLRQLEDKMADDAVLVADGGDFVATAAYILRPRAPLCWLDPGVFGTLGVGGGFGIGAATCRPGTEVWIIYGDGSCAYSLSEFDTFVRHGLAPIAVVGTDASWAQIARDQVEVLGDDVGTVLRRTSYEKVAEGYGGVGLLLDDAARIGSVLDEAKRHAREGRPVLVNVQIERSEFRKGSISV